MAKNKIAIKKPNIKNLQKVIKKPSKQTSLIVSALALAAILFGVSGWLWWTRIFTDQDRVFSDMLANNLSSPSVARTVSQKSQDSSVDQTIFISYSSPDVFSHTETVLSEKARNRQTTTVTTETIGTKDSDYVRYVSAEGAESLSIAGNLDEVIGVWAERSNSETNDNQAQFLNEAVFSIIPFGNLPKNERSELLEFIAQKNIYEIRDANREFVDGRYVYNYSLLIKPTDLVESLAKYSELSGIGDSSQLNPQDYQNAAPVVLHLKVDILTRQLLEIDYKGTGRVEIIEGRNLYRELSLPDNAVPFEELQSRLLGQTAQSERTQEGEHTHEDGTTHTH